MIRTTYFPKIGSPQLNSPLSAIQTALEDPEGLLWISLEQTSAEEATQVLDQIFHFHPLSIEDCLSVGYQTPKIDDYGGYLFITTMALLPEKDLDTAPGQELNIYLGNNFVVSSFTSEQMPPVDKLWGRIERDERLHLNGSDYLCHALLDYLVDEYIPYMEELEDEVDLLEDAVLVKPSHKTLERILQLKRHTMLLRRIIAPQRELINKLCRDDYPMIDQHSRLYFRDIYDHLVRIYDMVDVIRDMTTSTLEVYLNATSMRLNEVMKTLTIVSTIFLPLTFLAGVYGMNFRYMPELDWPLGYPMIWVVFILISTSMLYYFRRKGWF